MGPVAIQCGWSMRVMAMKEVADSGAPTPEFSPEARERAFATNLNTCHIWDEDGDQVRLIRSGGTLGAPLSVSKRLEKLGRSPDEWAERRG